MLIQQYAYAATSSAKHAASETARRLLSGCAVVCVRIVTLAWLVDLQVISSCVSSTHRGGKRAQSAGRQSGGCLHIAAQQVGEQLLAEGASCICMMKATDVGS